MPRADLASTFNGQYFVVTGSTQGLGAASRQGVGHGGAQALRAARDDKKLAAEGGGEFSVGHEVLLSCFCSAQWGDSGCSRSFYEAGYTPDEQETSIEKAS